MKTALQTGPQMAKLPRRDLRAELAKHGWGTPTSRVDAALRLGEEALDLYLATLPARTRRAEARARMQRTAHPGRRPSGVMRSLGA